MNRTVMRPLGHAAALAVAFTLGGCATAPQSLYGWGSYQAQVYEHFKTQGNGPEAQLMALQADLEKLRSKGQTPPPGYHAHLGMLYASLGKEDQAVGALEAEKGLFPESATYIDRLLAKYKK